MLVWWGVLVLFSLPMLVGCALVGLYLWIRRHFADIVVRILREKPLFIIPRGKPITGAEEVELHTADGLTLRGCYLKCEGHRRGVILFGLEFASERWACLSYCESLIQAGYDVFSFEPRNQGESDRQPDYVQLQWATDRDLIDMQTAIEYLKHRPDADQRGIGLFGVSKGGSVGMIAASQDPYIRCAATDGIFAIYTTMLPYMRKWITIYSDKKKVQGLLPTWFVGWIAMDGVHTLERQDHVRFLHLESAMRKFRRPLLMIHGAGDTYIKPQMAETLYSKASGTKELWLVTNAKHNQALHVAGDEYHRRVREFFDRHLGTEAPVENVPTLASH